MLVVMLEIYSHFKNTGVKILGVDPAKNICKIANSRGIKTINSFFKSICKKIKKKTIKLKLLLAQTYLHT